MTRTRAIAALTAAALVVPAATAVAKPDHAGKGKPEAAAKGKGKGKAKAKKVKTFTYTFSGVFEGGSATGAVITVVKGNAFVKKAELAGQSLTFDLTAAKLRVADADGDGPSFADLAAGDKVVVHFRAPRVLEDGTSLKATKLVDQTRPPVGDDAAAPAPAQAAPAA